MANTLYSSANAGAKPNSSGSGPPKLLRYLDAAKQLSVSLNHLRGLIDSGHLTSVKVGQRARRVPATEVEAFIRHGFQAQGNN